MPNAHKRLFLNCQNIFISLLLLSSAALRPQVQESLCPQTLCWRSPPHSYIPHGGVVATSHDLKVTGDKARRMIKQSSHPINSFSRLSNSGSSHLLKGSRVKWNRNCHVHEQKNHAHKDKSKYTWFPSKAGFWGKFQRTKLEGNHTFVENTTAWLKLLQPSTDKPQRWVSEKPHFPALSLLMFWTGLKLYQSDHDKYESYKR